MLYPCTLPDLSIDFPGLRFSAPLASGLCPPSYALVLLLDVIHGFLRNEGLLSISRLPIFFLIVFIDLMFPITFLISMHLCLIVISLTYVFFLHSGLQLEYFYKYSVNTPCTSV
jgi:hypothetical protein